MALPPRYAGLRLPIFNSPTQTVHTLELFLDYVCPFSKKLFNTVYTSVYPHITQQYPRNLSIIFRPQIQPWHPSSTLCVEAATAVQRLNPDAFWPFSKALFDKQIDFFDVNVVAEGRNQTYERLAKVAAEVGIDKNALLDLLRVPERPQDDSYNVGNKVTDDVKKMVKANRLVGVHVTPTVLFNGLVENGISSSFTKDDWEKWLKENVV